MSAAPQQSSSAESPSHPSAADSEESVLDGPVVSRDEQRTEWLAQFLHSPSSFHARAVHRSVDERGLKESRGLRGVYWRLFLGVLDRRDLGQWAAQTSAAREAYAQLAKKHSLHIRREGESDERSRSSSAAVAAAAPSPQTDVDLKIHNPLSAAQSSLWSQYQADHELGETIRHDLTRTHADREWFCQARVQELMFNVLFIWGKEEGKEEEGRYRQGFNELLAPVVLVLLRESQTRDGWPATGATTAATAADDVASSASGGVNDESLLPLLLDRDFVEHDVYALFCRIMASMSAFFAKVETMPRAAILAARKRALLSGGGGAGNSLSLDAESAADLTPIIKKCNYIHHILLSTLDPQLYTYLNRLERTNAAGTEGLASPTTAVARRGPASPPPAAAAAQQQQGFVLAEYMCIAMLLYVRQALLQGDNSYCLKRLLRYPPVEDVRVLLARALHFANGWKAITSDPTLTREAWNAQDEDHLGVPRSQGVGAGVGPSGLREPQEDPAAFQGPWQTISSGDMGADAPLEDPLRNSNSNHFSKPSSSSATTIGGLSASDAKNAISNSFASLKSFVKSSIANAGSNNNSGSSGNHHQSKHQHQQHQQGNHGANKTKYASATLAAPGRKAPTASGVSHFLGGSGGSGNAPSKSTSPPAGAPAAPSAIVSGPSAQEHDELVLLRKAAASARKEADAAIAAAHVLKQQLADARLVQTQMGALMQQSIDHIEREVAHAHGEIMPDEDNVTTEEQGATDAAAALAPPAVVEGADAPKADTESASAAALEPASAEVAASVPAPLDTAAAAAPAAAASPVSPRPRSRPLNEDVLLVSLAELKHIKDVLIGRLTLSDIIEHLQSSDPSAPSPKGSPTAAAAAAKPAGASAAVAASASSPTAEAAAARAQILADMAALHARQEAAARATSSSSSSGGGSTGSGGSGGSDAGSCFPYNLPPPPAKKYAPLFEPEVKARDKVSELFQLHEDDALPGLYPAIHKPSGTSATGEEAPAATKADDPLLSTPATTTTAAPASTAATSASTGTTAVAATATPASAPPATAAPAAVTNSILSGLLSSPLSGGSGLSGGLSLSSSGSSRSLFESPPSSPRFGGAGGGGDDSFLEHLLPQPRARATAVLGGGFRLEEDDSSIVLPSAKAFKEKPRPVPKPPKPAAPAAAAAPSVAPVAVPAEAPSKTAPAGPVVKPATSPVLPATQVVGLFPSESAAAAAPTSSASPPFPLDDPLSSPAAPAARSTTDVEDPLQWMGTGGK